MRATVSPSVYVPGVLRMAGMRSLTVVRPRRADWPHGALRRTARRLGQSGMNPLAAAALAAAITTQEGFYPGSVSYRNNNPGNLMYAGQPGATQGAGGFAVFDTLADGQAALVNQINLDATRGTGPAGDPTVTVGQLISSWAPASAGNDPTTYAANVSAMTGYATDAPLLELGAPDSSMPDPLAGSDDGLDLTSDLTAAASSISPGWLAVAAAVALFTFLR